MNVRPKRMPRLWCARLGLLPFDVVLPSGMVAVRADRERSATSAPEQEKTANPPFLPDRKAAGSEVRLAGRLRDGE